ncbi:MAG: relaxase/mobilization nuclease domain-containing protein [Eubacterium sp.]
MATLNFIKRKDVKNIESLGNVIAYCSQEYKTKYKDSRLISGINCLPETAMKEFIATKKHWNKQDGMQYYYAVQSFEDGLNISPLLAHQMAREWAEKCYPNHEIYIATHLDTDNVHSHIVINSVNMKTGYKIHQSTKELNEMRKVNDELCIKYGLPVCVPKKKQKVKPLKAKEYYVANAGKSWKMKMILSIEYAMKKAKTKQQFIEEMDKLGYEIRWTPTRKNITYIEKENPNHKCRDNNLHQEKFLKEKMEEEFEIRERLTSLERKEQTPNFYYGESSIRYDSGERLLESTDKSNGESKSDFRFDNTKSSERGYSQSLFSTDYSSTEKEDDRTGEYNSERTEESGNNTDRTGWEDEREYAFGRKTDEGFAEGSKEEMDTDILWNDDRSSNILSDTLYFAGNLFKMIDNQTRCHRKRIKLSQKEIEKRLAQGQKSDGYEEYEDYTQTM